MMPLVQLPKVKIKIEGGQAVFSKERSASADLLRDVSRRQNGVLSCLSIWRPQMVLNEALESEKKNGRMASVGASRDLHGASWLLTGCRRHRDVSECH